MVVIAELGDQRDRRLEAAEADRDIGRGSAGVRAAVLRRPGRAYHVDKALSDNSDHLASRQGVSDRPVHHPRRPRPPRPRGHDRHRGRPRRAAGHPGARRGQGRRPHRAQRGRPRGRAHRPVRFRRRQTSGRSEDRRHRPPAGQSGTAPCASAPTRPCPPTLIDDSTTLYPLAPALAQLDQLTVVTNSVGLAEHLGSAPGVEVTLLGGRYHSDFNSCTGPSVTRTLSRIHADLALMSATAVLDGRLFHPLSEYVEVKLAMLASAERALLLVDHSKFGKTATHAYGTVADYQAVLTDTGTPDAEVAAIRGFGVPIEAVDPGDPSP